MEDRVRTATARVGWHRNKLLEAPPIP